MAPFEMAPGRANEIAWQKQVRTANYIYGTDDPDGGNLRPLLNVDEEDPKTLWSCWMRMVDRKRRRT